ncbi:MAG: hypothetical protein H6Q00_1018 [Holophagaceae bacterium]|nr:hypothetical protein [Holophagaceae bacterium]
MTTEPIDLKAESPEDEGPKPKKSGVLVQKHKPAPASDIREKLCATCGKPFPLSGDQKFYDCPACYRKNHPVQKPQRKTGTQILIQIQCTACGATDVLDYMPPDPKQALCRGCYAEQKKREPKPQLKHKRSR